MRNDFVRQMQKEMARDKSVYFLTADLGFKALEPIEKAFPDRFINVGIAEQHMLGMAAGLALEGKKVIAYSIASFTSMRAFEQVRDDVCYHNLDVKLVGAGGGYNYAAHGVTHHTVEDLAIMRALPHMKVLNPGYSWEAAEATKAMLRTKGPFYVRLGKSPGIHFEKPSFKFALGRGFVVRDGRDIVIFSTGNVLDVAIKAAELAEKSSTHTVAVVSMPSVKPLDEALLRKLAKSAKAVFTLEEHSTIGGLGSAVKEVLFDASLRPAFHAFGLPADKFLKDVGDRNYLLDLVGLSPEKLAADIRRKLK